VVIYSGTDPSSATTFFQVGQYFIGSVPEGRRQAANFGGELFMLSQYGVLPMTGLLAGKSITDANLYASRNISPLIASDMNLYRTQYGWEMRNLPSENVFSVVVPKQPNLPYKQYARSTKTNGWTTFQALTYVTGDTWNGSFYIGGKNGVVYKITGNSDGVAVDGTGGVDVQWTFLSAFSDLGDTGQYHIPAFVRPVFRAAAIPSYGTACRFDYNTDDISLSISAPGASGFLWDAANALWDTALWGADAVTLDPVLGSSGLGRATAVAIQGASHAETQLIRTDLMFQTGGVI
jgi:hypothetical protein